MEAKAKISNIVMKSIEGVRLRPRKELNETKRAKYGREERNSA